MIEFLEFPGVPSVAIPEPRRPPAAKLPSSPPTPGPDMRELMNEDHRDRLVEPLGFIPRPREENCHPSPVLVLAPSRVEVEVNVTMSRNVTAPGMLEGDRRPLPVPGFEFPKGDLANEIPKMVGPPSGFVSSLHLISQEAVRVCFDGRVFRRRDPAGISARSFLLRISGVSLGLSQ